MSTSIGGPAFPCDWIPTPGGMTLRDYFAAQALQGLLAGVSRWREKEEQFVAETAYKMADAMLKAREAGK